MIIQFKKKSYIYARLQNIEYQFQRISSHMHVLYSSQGIESFIY